MRLDEILLAVVVNALGPDARVAVAREEWVRVEDAIRGPVTMAATAALERLVADLEATLPRHLPELVRRIGADACERSLALTEQAAIDEPRRAPAWRPGPTIIELEMPAR